MPDFPAHRRPQSRLRPKCTLAPPIRTIEEIEQRPIEALFGAALSLPEIEMRSEMKQDGGLKLKCRLRVMSRNTHGKQITTALPPTGDIS